MDEFRHCLNCISIKKGESNFYVNCYGIITNVKYRCTYPEAIKGFSDPVTGDPPLCGDMRSANGRGCGPNAMWFVSKDKPVVVKVKSKRKARAKAKRKARRKNV